MGTSIQLTTLLKEACLKVLAGVALTHVIPVSAYSEEKDGVASLGEVSEPRNVGRTPRQWSQFDMSGYWVSVITEDWAYRMITPEKGDAGSIPVNAASRDSANSWSPSSTTGVTSCKAYSPIRLIRAPGRIHIQWRDDRTIQMDFDAGMQTRLLHFPKELPPFGSGSSMVYSSFLEYQPRGVQVTRQGYSVAMWRKQNQGRGFLGDLIDARVPVPDAGGSLMVVTRQMLPGYLQENGIPFSGNAVLVEYFDLLHFLDGTDWLVVTSIVDDPTFLIEPYIFSTQFKREVGGGGWTPSLCDGP